MAIRQKLKDKIGSVMIATTSPCLHREGFVGKGQGTQLAARTGRPHLPGCASVLAHDGTTGGSASRQRHLEPVFGGEGKVTRHVGREQTAVPAGGAMKIQ